MMKRLCAFLTALVMVLCAVSALAENADSDPVLVTVNGEEVRESTEMVQIWKDYLLTQVEGEPDDETMQLVKQYAMNYAIEFIVAKQKLAELGLGYTEEELAESTAEVKKSWDDAVAEIAKEEFGVGEDATDDEKAAGKADAEAYILTNYGYTEKTYLAQVELNLIYTKAEDYAAANLEITDEDIAAYFDELVEEDRQTLLGYAGAGDSEDAVSDEELNKNMAMVYEYLTMYGYSLLYTPEGYRGITHILLPVEEELLSAWAELQAKLEEQNSGEAEGTDGEGTATETAETPVTQEMVDAARQAILDSVQGKIDEIKAKLAEGASFEELIPEYGTDPGMEDETRRASGYPVHAGSINYYTDFTNAAMALQNIGDVSEPVITEKGVHLLHYLRDIPGGAAELTDEMKEMLKEELEEQMRTTAYNNLVGEWMNASEVVWTEAGEPWKMPAEETEEAAAE